MSAKEVNINFRVSEEFRDYLYSELGPLDIKTSEFLRAAALHFLPLAKSIRGITRIQLEDMIKRNPVP